jgi:hypothetical protein
MPQPSTGAISEATRIRTPVRERRTPTHLIGISVFPLRRNPDPSR